MCVCVCCVRLRHIDVFGWMHSPSIVTPCAENTNSLNSWVFFEKSLLKIRKREKKVFVAFESSGKRKKSRTQANETQKPIRSPVTQKVREWKTRGLVIYTSRNGETERVCVRESENARTSNAVLRSKPIPEATRLHSMLSWIKHYCQHTPYTNESYACFRCKRARNELS